MKGYKNLIQILEDWKQPVFTSANTWGTVSADNYSTGSSQYPWQALDGKTSGGDEADFASSGAQTVNWFWDFPTPLKITAIKMWSRNNASNYGGATTYTIYGKNEDNSYEQIGTISLSAIAWVSGETNITSNKMYYGLKIYCSGNKSYVGIGEILLTAKKLANTHRLIKHKQSNTNVITHIANDIKLELDNGTLTLKAGSKVYVPNGFEEDGTTQKFDVVTIENDLSVNETFSGENLCCLFYNTTTNVLYQEYQTKCFSGATAPTVSLNYDTWYDTGNNTVKRTYDTGSTWTDKISLPIAITYRKDSSTKSIDQVFNGFGCIGSTIFVLPDVSGLIPDGFNADGSFKTTSFTTQTVLTNTYTDTATNDYYFQCGEGFCGRLSKTAVVYNPSENKSYWNNGGTWQQLYNVFDGTFRMESGKITSVSQLPTVQPSTIPIYKAVDLN